MSDLLLMATLGLPRNGLVGLWDPYRDTYGRNCLPVGANLGFDANGSASTIEAGTGDWVGWYKVTVQGTSYSNGLLTGAAWVSGASATFGIEAYSPDGVQIRIAGSTNLGTLYDGASPVGKYSKTVTSPDGMIRQFYFYTATTGEKVIYVRNPQLNLGSTLFPYSAPAGAPGTLQTSLDYSGNGNHLTLGATTNASTDDPAFTGTAWSFDGGDYLLTPNLGNGDITAYTVFKTPASVASSLGLWARNNVGMQIRTDLSIKFVYRNGAGTQTKSIDASPSTWYLAAVRATTAGYIAFSLSGIGTLADSGFGAIDGSFTTYGNYLGREYEYFHTSEIAYHAVYNWVHPDSLATRCRNHIVSLLAPRGIAL